MHSYRKSVLCLKERKHVGSDVFEHCRARYDGRHPEKLSFERESASIPIWWMCGGRMVVTDKVGLLHQNSTIPVQVPVAAWDLRVGRASVYMHRVSMFRR